MFIGNVRRNMANPAVTGSHPSNLKRKVRLTAISAVALMSM